MPETRRPLSEGEILSILKGEKQAARSDDNQLEEDRTRALDYYQGRPERGYMRKDLKPEEGRSHAVSTDVQNAIETVLPDIIEIFTSGDNVVAFTPQNKDDEAQAQQETDYVNYVFYRQNQGWMTLYENFKDALLSKTGVFKWWWEEADETEEAIFENMSPDEFRVFRNEAEKRGQEVFDLRKRDEEPERDPIEGTYSVRARKTVKRGRARVTTVAPEDFFIDSEATDISDATLAGHDSRVRAYKLIEQGFDADLVMSLSEYGAPTETEKQARNIDASAIPAKSTTTDPMLKIVEISEFHVWLDREGDGKVRCWKFITGNNESVILDEEEIAGIQFAVNRPYITPHTFYGKSLADLLVEIQKIKTALTRQMLDSYYMGVNPRPVISEQGLGNSTIADLKSNKPRRPIRVKGDARAALSWHSPPITGDQVQGALEYMSTVGEERSGVVRNAQGLNPDTLHDTARGAMELMNNAQRRVRMIARIFAETGVKDMFLGLHDLIVRHAKEKETVRLTDDFIEVDPNKWDRRKDLSIEVGLGTNTKQFDLQFWDAVLQKQVLAAQNGMADNQKIYNALQKYMQAGNVRSAELYFTNPAVEREDGEDTQEQEQLDPDVIKVQGELELKRQEMLADARLDQWKAQQEALLARYKTEIEAGLAEQAQRTQARIGEYKAITDANIKAAGEAAKSAREDFKAADNAITNVRFGGQVG